MLRQFVAVLSCLVSLPALASDRTKYVPEGNRRVPAIKRIVADPDATTVLKGPIGDATASFVVSQLKDAASRHKTIYLVINSGGGSIRAGNQIVNTIQSLRPVKTVCLVEGAAYSMAAIIASYCGETYMLRNSDIMFHNASVGFEMTELPKAVSRLNHYNDSIDEMFEDLARQLGVPYHELRVRCDSEWWLTARQAARFGLVDGVVNEITYTEKANPLDALLTILGRLNPFGITRGQP